MQKKMTYRQFQVLEHIRKGLQRTGIAPRAGEISKHFKFSVNNASQLLAVLEKNGFIVREGRKIVAVKLPKKATATVITRQPINSPIHPPASNQPEPTADVVVPTYSFVI